MENIALIDSFSEFKDDKLIDRVTLMAILEDVFRNALKKKMRILKLTHLHLLLIFQMKLKNLLKK